MINTFYYLLYNGLLLLPSIISLVRIYLISYNCVRESTLLLSGDYSIVCLSGPNSNPAIDGKFFSYALFLCYNFHVVRWRLFRDWTLLRRTWLRVTINDDFLKEGECNRLSLLPSIIYLGRFRIACAYKFNI